MKLAKITQASLDKLMYQLKKVLKLIDDPSIFWGVERLLNTLSQANVFFSKTDDCLVALVDEDALETSFNFLRELTS